MSYPNIRTYYFDQDDLKCHMKIIKSVGVMDMILVTLCIPVYILACMEWTNQYPLDYEVKVEVNQTVCSYLKQFYLKDSIYQCVKEKSV